MFSVAVCNTFANAVQRGLPAIESKELSKDEFKDNKS
jgi:hypothetical protein